jgi:hypothetical protein
VPGVVSQSADVALQKGCPQPRPIEGEAAHSSRSVTDDEVGLTVSARAPRDGRPWRQRGESPELRSVIAGEPSSPPGDPLDGDLTRPIPVEVLGADSPNDGHSAPGHVSHYIRGIDEGRPTFAIYTSDGTCPIRVQVRHSIGEPPAPKDVTRRPGKEDGIRECCVRNIRPAPGPRNQGYPRPQRAQLRLMGPAEGPSCEVQGDDTIGMDAWFNDVPISLEEGARVV